MLIAVVAIFWVVVITWLAVDHFRDRSGVRSVDEFHTEFQNFDRRSYAIEPAHRLPRPASAPSYQRPVANRNIVHADDALRLADKHEYWRRWSDEQEFDEGELRSQHRYAAYASTPQVSVSYDDEERTYVRPVVSAGVMRRRWIGGLAGSAVLLSLLSYLSGISLVADLSYLAWVGTVLYVAAAVYSMSQGWLTLGTRRSSYRDQYQDAPVEAYESATYDDEYEYDYQDDYQDEAEDGFYTPQSDGWQRAPQQRRAFG